MLSAKPRVTGQKSKWLSGLERRPGWFGYRIYWISWVLCCCIKHMCPNICKWFRFLARTERRVQGSAWVLADPKQLKVFRSLCLILTPYEISSSSLLVGPPPVLVSPHGGPDDPASKDGWWLDFQSTQRTYFNVETFSFSPSAGKPLSESRESKGDFSDVVGSWTGRAIFEIVCWIILIGGDIRSIGQKWQSQNRLLVAISKVGELSFRGSHLCGVPSRFFLWYMIKLELRYCHIEKLYMWIWKLVFPPYGGHGGVPPPCCSSIRSTRCRRPSWTATWAKPGVILPKWSSAKTCRARRDNNQSNHCPPTRDDVDGGRRLNHRNSTSHCKLYKLSS